MRERIKRALRRIAAEERLEARWLQTLSYLEFVGARKISRTVAASHPRAEVLDHLAGEARRSAVLSELAHSMVGGNAEYLSRDAARTYFLKLDRELSAWTAELVGHEHQPLNYLLVSSMIERRAMMLYPLYRNATSSESVRAELARIISDGEPRRTEIERDCVRLLSEWQITDLAAPSAVESAFFAEFWRALEVELGLEEPLAA